MRFIFGFILGVSYSYSRFSEELRERTNRIKSGWAS